MSQEIAPYLPKSELSALGRDLPQAMQQAGYEVRTFMPKYGAVNERRNQLHEVIRLSGMNICIADSDHPLILKVASMQPSRIQVYFIDNDDYFIKNDDDIDPIGSNRADNDERAIFFARGTMETVKKLRWEPDIVHCAGWITAILPMYMQHLYADDPSFANAKIVYTVLPGEIECPVDPKLFDKLKDDGMTHKEIEPFLTDKPDTKTLHKMAIRNSNGVIFRTDEPDKELVEYAQSLNIPILFKADVEGKPETYAEFYKQLMA